jgi:hypothetical protein
MPSAMRKARQSVTEQVTGGVNALQALAGELADALAALAEGRPPQIEELTMADVVGFFVEHRKSVPEAAAAAILRDQPDSASPAAGDGTGYLVHLFFLDKDGRPMIDGRQPKRAYLARQFDNELVNAFGTNNIIIFN